MTSGTDSSTPSSLPHPSRRAVLAGTGVAAAASLLPASLHRAMAEPARPGGLGAVEHVVLLMQENRSFDHYYGRLRGVRGYGDRHPLRRRDGAVAGVLEQPDGPLGAAASVLPFSLREAARAEGRPAGDIQYLNALPHGFTDATDAWASGWWDGWVPAKGRASMTYYDRTDVPLQYELSETFTTLDAYHCSVYGSTNPNRNYFWSGTTGQEPDGSGRAVTNAAYSYDHAGYDWTTYPERLESAGVSWQIYQEWDNFTDNAVEYFATFKRIGTTMLAHVDGDYRTTEELYDSLHDKTPAEQDAVLAQLEEGRAALSAAERSLFDRAMYRSRPGTLLDRIAADIADGTLPTVTWVVPPASLSEHPSASTPVGSAGLVHDLLDVVASHRHTWSRTAVLLNFDENDGFFDHVPPPTAPRPAGGESDDWTRGRPVGPGPRVPMTIVSPWTIGGHVDSAPADHTSTLRFLERVTGVREPNISRWRRSVLSDLTGAFDFERAGRPPVLEQPGTVPAAVERWKPQPPTRQRLPRQERGRRPARAVPQRPAVTARVDGRGLELVLRNPGRVALPFTVYPFVGTPAVGPGPTFVTVGARDKERVTVRPGLRGRWDVVVQGPDRFWSEHAGSLRGEAADVDLVIERGWGDRLRLGVPTTGEPRVRVVVEDRSRAGNRRRGLRLRPDQQEWLGWDTDHGWYDLRLTSPDDDTFVRRVAGRLPSGRAGLTA